MKLKIRVLSLYTLLSGLYYMRRYKKRIEFFQYMFDTYINKRETENILLAKRIFINFYKKYDNDN